MAERIIEVDWEDTFAKCGWQPQVTESPKDPLVKSVGYVRVDDERGLVITAGYIKQNWRGEFVDDCATFIPRSAIRKVTELRPKGRK